MVRVTFHLRANPSKIAFSQPLGVALLGMVHVVGNDEPMQSLYIGVHDSAGNCIVLIQ